MKKGISNKQAAIIIGNHFPNVGDKLLNLLDLSGNAVQSELLMASINQRSASLDGFSFTKAVDLKENRKYAKYALIPLVIIGVIWISGDIKSFFGSYNRMVNYDLAYEPPAPFAFRLLSTDLEVLETDSFTVEVTTEGSVRPEQISFISSGKEILLQQRGDVAQYTFTPPLASTSFRFIANGIYSKEYRLRVLKTPVIQNFNMFLEYPKYIGKKSEIISSTGNAVLPEGTSVTWKVKGHNIKTINLSMEDSIVVFSNEKNDFEYSKRIYKDTEYRIDTSNENVQKHETLNYKLQVVKDTYPLLEVNQVNDSINPNISYYVGEASDDYRLVTVDLVCYPVDDEDNVQKINLGSPNANFKRFYYTFPSGLKLDTDKEYAIYFLTRDNDAIHGGKTTKSTVFNAGLLNSDELRKKELALQESLIKDMDKSLNTFKDQKEELDEINKENKEKTELNFNDQNEIKDFLKKQEQQEKLMQKFSKQLKENLDKGNKEDKLNKLLQERLERRELEAKKNEELLKMLQEVADKIKKDELTKKLEEVAKNQKNSQRSLEQLLELTRRYYVTEKAAQLSRELEKLAAKQEEASEREEEKNVEREQKNLNEEFEKLAKELEELRKDNKELHKPMDLNSDKSKEDKVKKDQENASEELKKEESAESSETEKKEAGSKAKKSQKAAAKKMKQMSDELQQSSDGGGGSSIVEDSEMLRQILDNLVIFSFKQETLHNTIDVSDENVSQISSSIRKQQELRTIFEHVDDSLFALSLRRAELSDFVNEQITEVFYNVDKSLERIANRELYQGMASQKHVLTASNNLADFLAGILDNMQMSMSSGSGKGEGKGFQLPDIIKSQGDLKEKMGESGKKGKGKEGKEGKSGSSGKEGEKGAGKSGKKGKSEGISGENGNTGENGEGDGKNGKSGKGNRKGESEKEGKGGAGGLSEKELEEIYEIYKSQQQIKDQLEQQLKDFISDKDKYLAKKLVKLMEDFQNDLLENGVTQRSKDKVNYIQHELLKLENASLKQGKKKERESITNTNKFQNPITTKPMSLENYKNQIEILNRQALPLQRFFQNKVKNYFKSDD